MQITVTDDFNLDKIIKSGQCFRAEKLVDGKYRFITGKHMVHILPIAPFLYEEECTKNEWNSIWHTYFDLDTNYKKIRESIDNADVYLQKAAEYSKGIRILRQDSFEMLITFIISQRKSIPAIRDAINKLCIYGGEKIFHKNEEFLAFPTIETLHQMTIEELKSCSLGYRASYIQKTIDLLIQKQIHMNHWTNLSDEDLVEKLMEFPGVGIKVANCVALFGYYRVSRAPIDVWIDRVIQEVYEGNNPFTSYPVYAGIMQQYMFYYRREIGVQK